MNPDPRDNELFAGADPKDQTLQFPIPERSRAVHSYCLGASGVGKSKMMLDWVLQDIVAGRGCAVIDPKGDLIFDILAALSDIDEQWWPGITDRLVLIDPSDPAHSASFNPLQVADGTTPARQRQEVFSIFRRIWGLDGTRAPRMDLVLRRTIHLLMESGLTIADMPRVLVDGDLRARLLTQTQDPNLISFWLHEFPEAGSARQQWTAPILTRIGSFLDDPSVREMMGRTRSSVNFRTLMDRGGILLGNLAKGRVGEETSHLLGGFLMAKLQLAAESRQSIWPPERRRRFYVYVDEFQNYQTSSLPELLAEARGYGLSMIMAHQNLAQIDSRLREAVMGNARIRACFRVSYEDSELMTREMFRIRGDRVKERELMWLKLGKIPLPIGFNYKYFSASEEARQNRAALHALPDRRFWLHLADSDSIVELRTIDIPRFDRRRAEERIARFKDGLAGSARALPPPQQSSLPSVSNLPGTPPPLPALDGLYHWSPPRRDRRPPRIR